MNAKKSRRGYWKSLQHKGPFTALKRRLVVAFLLVDVHAMLRVDRLSKQSR